VIVVILVAVRPFSTTTTTFLLLSLLLLLLPFLRLLSPSFSHSQEASISFPRRHHHGINPFKGRREEGQGRHAQGGGRREAG